MNDWADITTAALTYTEPVVENTYEPVMSGPQPAGSPTAPPNQVLGDMVLPQGASLLLSGGGAIKNNGRGSDFEISEDVGLLAKGPGINLAAIMSSAYNSAPIAWYSETSFAEVTVTAPYPSSPKAKFYSDAFKRDITGNLTVSSVVDNGDSWTITFTGATLTADMQVGNMIEPDWVTPWWKYLEIVANGSDWVEVLNPGVAAPVATNTFSLHGVYANTIMTWTQPYAIWFTAGANKGAQGFLETGYGLTVDWTTGLVTLMGALDNDIVAGDRLKAYAERVRFAYNWNTAQLVLAPSVVCPDDLDMCLGVGQWDSFRRIYLRAKEGIYLCPAYATHDKVVHVANSHPSSAYRAHLQIDLGNLTIADGDLIIKDGRTAPAATSGLAKLYVDAADGDLKVIFGDGTVKTIVTDT